MAFYNIMIVAVALVVLANGRLTGQRRSQHNMVGGWSSMNPSDIPENVTAELEQRMIGRINSENGVRLAQITRAEKQVVSGINYKLTTVFHVTQCPSSSSRQEINDENVCPQASSLTCKVKFYHQSWTQTFRILKSKCNP